MSKRKRRKDRRKRQYEEPDMVKTSEEVPGDMDEPGNRAQWLDEPEPEVTAQEPEAGPLPAVEERTAAGEHRATGVTSAYKEKLLLLALVVYVLLLGLGTVGELFEVESILNFPLFR